MKIFTTKDQNGKEYGWEIAFAFGRLRRLKAECGIDLLSPDVPVNEDGRATVVTLLYGNIEQLFEVVCKLLKSQLEASKVSEDQFADMLDDHGLRVCRDAFFGEWSDFFIRAGMPPYATCVTKTIEAMVQHAEKAAGMTYDEMRGLASIS